MLLPAFAPKLNSRHSSSRPYFNTSLGNQVVPYEGEKVARGFSLVGLTLDIVQYPLMSIVSPDNRDSFVHCEAARANLDTEKGLFAGGVRSGRKGRGEGELKVAPSGRSCGDRARGAGGEGGEAGAGRGEGCIVCSVMYEGGPINTAAEHLKPASFSRHLHFIPFAPVAPRPL